LESIIRVLSCSPGLHQGGEEPVPGHLRRSHPLTMRPADVGRHEPRLHAHVGGRSQDHTGCNRIDGPVGLELQCIRHKNEKMVIERDMPSTPGMQMKHFMNFIRKTLVRMDG
jgi:hypothetical protein